MNDPAPIPTPVPAPSPLSNPIIKIPLSLTPTQMSLTRQQLFDISSTPITLPLSRFTSLWPWIDNVYVRKKTRAATGHTPRYELWACRNKRKHPPTTPATPTARRGRPGATCPVGLKLVWNRYIEGEERTVTITRYSEETHTHTLDDIDKQKRNSALRSIAGMEAQKAQPHEVVNAMRADMEVLAAVGGRYITRVDAKNASISYETRGQGQDGEGAPVNRGNMAEGWQDQVSPGAAPTESPAPRREEPAHAPPPTDAPALSTPSPPPPPLSATTLLLIDSQRGFTHPTHWGRARSNPGYEANVATLLSHFRALRLAHPGAGPGIIHVRHASQDPKSPLHPDAAGYAWMPYTTPIAGEEVVTKGVNSAFIGTDLEEMLRAAGTRRLYVAGLSTDHCVSTSVRMAGNLGVVDGEWGKGEVVLVGDATACWEKVGGGWKAEIVHAVHVESLREFARVGWTGEVVRECVG